MTTMMTVMVTVARGKHWLAAAAAAALATSCTTRASNQSTIAAAAAILVAAEAAAAAAKLRAEVLGRRRWSTGDVRYVTATSAVGRRNV